MKNPKAQQVVTPGTTFPVDPKRTEMINRFYGPAAGYRVPTDPRAAEGYMPGVNPFASYGSTFGEFDQMATGQLSSPLGDGRRPYETTVPVVVPPTRAAFGPRGIMPPVPRGSQTPGMTREAGAQTFVAGPENSTLARIDAAMVQTPTPPQNIASQAISTDATPAPSPTARGTSFAVPSFGESASRNMPPPQKA